MTPRIYTSGRGYEEVRRPGRVGVSDSVKHHRLLAYAWGIIDGLDDGRDIHHVSGVPWDNRESNLEAVDPVRHGRITRGVVG